MSGNQKYEFPKKTSAVSQTSSSQPSKVSNRPPSSFAGIRNECLEVPVDQPCLMCAMLDEASLDEKGYPCDVDMLRFTTKDVEVGTSTPLANRPSLYQAPYPPDDSKRAALTKIYDTVLEIIAPPLNNDKHVDPAEIYVSFAHTGSGCDTPGHDAVRIIPKGTGEYDSHRKTELCSENNRRTIKAYGPERGSDSGGFNYAEVIAFFKDGPSPKQFEVIAEGCGRREDGMPSKKRIKGLVVVHRQEGWLLKLSIPSFKRRGGEISKNMGKTGKWERQKTVNDETKVSRRSPDASRYGHAETQIRKRSLHGTVVTEGGGSKSQEFAKYEPNLKVERNGISLEIGDTITNLFRIKKIWDETQKLVKDLSKLVPKVGFSFEWEMEFLMGSLEVNLGQLRSSSRYSDDHYHWVEKSGEITVELVLFKGEIEVGFGIEAESPDILNWFGKKAFELVLKVSAELEADLTLSGTFDLYGPSGRTQPTIGNKGTEEVLTTLRGTLVPDISIQAKVTVLGYGVDAQAGVEWGIEGEFSLVKPLNLRAGFKRRELRLYAYWTHGKRKPAPQWEKELVPETRKKEIYCFN